MLEDVVLVPLDDSPVELLPPGSGYPEPTRGHLTQGGNGRRAFEVALQVPVGTKLLKDIRHMSPLPRVGLLLSSRGRERCRLRHRPRGRQG